MLASNYDGMDRSTVLGLIAADEAMNGSLLSRRESRIVNVFVGSSKGGLNNLLSACSTRRTKVPPDFLMESLHTATSDAIARQFGFDGLRMAYISSCTTGIHSIIMGAKYIAEGRGEIVLAGATEASINPLMLAGYESMELFQKTPQCLSVQ